MEHGNRALVFKEIGEFEKVLHLLLLPKPQISPGHVLVRIVLRPVHQFDLVLCSDLSVAEVFFDLSKNSETPKNTGVVAGHEGGLGIVEEIGDGVTLCSPGQRVHLDITFSYFLPYFQGSWQDYILIKEESAIPVPDKIEDDIAAQFSSNPWTVYGLCKEIDSPKGGYILITAATSTVGRLFIQLAAHEGYNIIAIVRREDVKEELISLGAVAVINSALEDVPKVVKQITNGEGAYLGIDLVGGTLTKSAAASVRDGGQVMVIGELGSGDVVISQKDLWRNVEISSWNASSYFLEKEKKEAAIKACWKLFEEGIWTLPPALKFDLSDFKQALHETRKSARAGKVLLQTK
ncbi:hypothetical protein O6H91_15G044000 [Diphasiastrum complanatum]|uniref:Uncharacterized protein n=1 Tax=Diphasiastrum complanatum TaxID=34168 RepID=A0ACC2BHX6_DIPCM|nr:hypothetical protein O6H91_15G044000 [Diphasiastrum complanatum]